MQTISHFSSVFIRVLFSKWTGSRSTYCLENIKHVNGKKVECDSWKGVERIIISRLVDTIQFHFENGKIKHFSKIIITVLRREKQNPLHCLISRQILEQSISSSVVKWLQSAADASRRTSPLLWGPTTAGTIYNNLAINWPFKIVMCT